VQIIVVSRHLKAARTITIMPRHVLAALLLFATLVFMTSVLFSWLSVHFRLPLVENLVISLQAQETQKTRDYITSNLDLMASKLGELQGRLLQLHSLGERVSDLTGIKPEGAPTPPAPGEGGPYLPAALSAGELQQEIERLAAMVEQRSDDLAFMEFKLLEKRVKERLLPTTLPVQGAALGSGFGYRVDPFVGTRARHEGLDFSADTGAPVLAAADGRVEFAGRHDEYGNMVDIDHGDGLLSRYAHLSRLDVQAGQRVRRGERLGAVGSTGRSTGPHLHFEVRMLGVAQNPLHFLKRGPEYAQMRRH